MTKEDDRQKIQVFDLHEVAAKFPRESNSLLIDRYLVRNASASARIFCVYRGTPAHYHVHSEEFLYVLSGRGTYWIGDPTFNGEFRAGQLLAFPRGTVHAMPELLEQPVVFLALDVPLRDLTDVVFISPEEAGREDFIQELRES